MLCAAFWLMAQRLSKFAAMQHKSNYRPFAKICKGYAAMQQNCGYFVATMLG
jgi:hypothetical protein